MDNFEYFLELKLCDAQFVL
uniref:Uncharacterized protein n=1 Tax=Arundo donax TaxID=35708 RepID=A0A0A9HQI0_ARUDO